VSEIDPQEAGARGAQAFDVTVKAPGVMLGLSTMDEVIRRIPAESAPSLWIGHGGAPVVRVRAWSAEEATDVVAAAIAQSGRRDIQVVTAINEGNRNQGPE
jgi:hypothetical protein